MKHSTQKTSPEYEILYFDMEDPAPWESGFIEVDRGYSVQAVASAPVDGRLISELIGCPVTPRIKHVRHSAKRRSSEPLVRVGESFSCITGIDMGLC